MSPLGSDGLVIGVDVGGTKVAAALVEPGGAILFQMRRPMVADGGAESGLAAVASAIEAVSAKASGAPMKLIHGIGICARAPSILQLELSAILLICPAGATFLSPARSPGAIASR